MFGPFVIASREHCACVWKMHRAILHFRAIFGCPFTKENIT